MNRQYAASLFFAAVLSISIAAAAAEGHDILRSGTTPSAKGAPTMFTGSVRQDQIAKADANSAYNITIVTFEPGARTFWHEHPAGQRLLVTSGKGLIGTSDGRVDVIRAGDFVWCPPGVKHWHGAAPDTAMSHLAFTNVKNGSTSVWYEALANDEYERLAASAKDPLLPAQHTQQ